MIFRCASFLLGFAFSGLAASEPFYTPERDQYAVEKPEEKTSEELPKVLLIGDSIMAGYYKQTKQLLAGEAQVFRHPGNAGETRNGLKKVDQWLGDTEWDVISRDFGTEMYVAPGDVHHTAKGNKKLAAAVAAAVREQLR